MLKYIFDLIQIRDAISEKHVSEKVGSRIGREGEFYFVLES